MPQNIMISKRILLSFLAVTVILTLKSSPALAHKINIFAWAEGQTVFTESYFTGGKLIEGGMVEVFDSAGQKLLEGRTDQKGEFSFKLPQKTDLLLVLTASMGHKSDFTLKVENADEAAPAAEPAKITGELSPDTVTVDMRQLRTVIEETLDLRLKPIYRSLADAKRREGPSLTNIIGGLGYIIGIMGLILYVRSRKKK
jgi:nickel transport protein